MRSLLIVSALGAVGAGGAALRTSDTPAVPAAPSAAAPANGAQRDEVFEACVPPAERGLALADVPMERRRSVAACVIRMLAPAMNEGLPARTDPMTTLIAVRAEQTTMTYRYRLDLAAADLGAALRAGLESRVRADVCAAGAMRPVFAFGGRIRFDYVDRVGSPVLAVEVPGC